MKNKDSEKYCPRCERWMDKKKDYYVNKKNKDGLQHYCKDCQKEYYDTLQTRGKK